MIRLDNHAYSVTDLPNYVKLGAYSSVGKDVIFHSLNMEHQCSINHSCVYTYNWDQSQEAGEIVIGNDVWVGDGVRILPNVHIGDGAVIGAGSVIAHDVEPYAVMVGNPAKLVRLRFAPIIIRKLLEMKWWEWEEKIISDRHKDMLDIYTFMDKYYAK